MIRSENRETTESREECELNSKKRCGGEAKLISRMRGCESVADGEQLLASRSRLLCLLHSLFHAIDVPIEESIQSCFLSFRQRSRSVAGASNSLHVDLAQMPILIARHTPKRQHAIEMIIFSLHCIRSNKPVYASLSRVGPSRSQTRGDAVIAAQMNPVLQQRAQANTTRGTQSQNLFVTSRVLLAHLACAVPYIWQCVNSEAPHVSHRQIAHDAADRLSVQTLRDPAFLERHARRSIPAVTGER